MQPPTLQLDRVSLTYAGRRGERLEAIREVSIAVGEGERVSIVGPSGCGKSSLLALISGIRRPTSGRLLYQGKEISGPSHERVIIFQDHALFPWKTAQQNVEFALRARSFPGDVSEEAEKRLVQMGLGDSMKRYPRELSGGMQQRVGIARALAADPKVLLLDEPFAALDPITRSRVLEEVSARVAALNKTLIMITHSVEEAMYIGTRVLVMVGRPGSIVSDLPMSFEKPAVVTDMKLQPAFAAHESKIHGLLRGESCFDFF